MERWSLEPSTCRSFGAKDDEPGPLSGLEDLDPSGCYQLGFTSPHEMGGPGRAS